MNPLIALVFACPGHPAWHKQRPAGGDAPGPEDGSARGAPRDGDAFSPSQPRHARRGAREHGAEEGPRPARRRSAERFKEFFRRGVLQSLFSVGGRVRARATGSGVLVDRRIHLDEQPRDRERSDIIVRLSDQRKFTARRSVDTQDRHRLLKVDAPGALPAAAGRSDICASASGRSPSGTRSASIAP